MRLTLLTVTLLPSLALAQDPKASTGPRGEFGIDFTSQYFFRGILQENQGIIVQPYAELTYDITEKKLKERDKDKDFVRDFEVTFGTWNSLHEHDDANGAGGIWYESDFYIDVGAKVADNWKLDARYTAYTSPNGSFNAFSAGRFNTVQEIAFSAHIDDKGGRSLLFDFESGLQPHATIAFELDGQRDFGNQKGIYVEAGVEPSFKIGKLGDGDLTFSLPVTIGLSLSDYYESVGGGDSDTFGFLDVGGRLSSPLTFMPPRFGKWNADAALHFLLLGDNTGDFNSNDSSEIIFTFGVSTTF